MKIISFNQKWIFKNELKNIPEQTVDLPHDAMLTEKRLPEGKAGAAGAYFPGRKIQLSKRPVRGRRVQGQISLSRI